MKHARNDYTRRIQDAEKLIPDDEPVFLIRGQDQVGHNAVRAWANLHRTNGGSDVAFSLAMAHADRMEEWAKKHGKPADVPASEVPVSSPPKRRDAKPTTGIQGGTE